MVSSGSGMNEVVIFAEDEVSRALAWKILSTWLPTVIADDKILPAGGKSKLLQKAPRLIDYATYQPVFCLADADKDCAKKLKQKWLGRRNVEGLLLWFAVPETESWVLADYQGFCNFFNIKASRTFQNSDEISDPKQLLLNLVRKSKDGKYRHEMIHQDFPDRPGTGYNLHLSRFVRSAWNPVQARHFSLSLDRLYIRLQNFLPESFNQF